MVFSVICLFKVFGMKLLDEHWLLALLSLIVHIIRHYVRYTRTILSQETMFGLVCCRCVFGSCSLMATGCWRHSKGTKPLLLALKSGVTTKSVCPPAVKVPASSGTLCECTKTHTALLFFYYYGSPGNEMKKPFFIALHFASFLFFAVTLLRIMQKIVL